MARTLSLILLAVPALASMGCRSFAGPSGYTLRVANATTDMVSDVAVTFHYDDPARPSLGPSSIGVVGPRVSATDHFIPVPVRQRITVFWTRQDGKRIETDVKVPADIGEKFQGTLAITIQTENADVYVYPPDPRRR